MVQTGGQTAVKLIQGLEKAGLRLYGTSSAAIDRVEDRELFYRWLNELEIPHIPGATAASPEEVFALAEKLGYPLLLRPSYVIGGQGMMVVHSPAQLATVMATYDQYGVTEAAYPLLLDRFMEGIEVEVDAVTDGRDVVIHVLVQHVERAGVHSGDSISFLPAIDLPDEVRDRLVDYTERMARSLSHKGLLNIQFVIHDGEVRVLEVNPRASRTVPIVSKVTGVPMIEWATRVQMGEALADFAPTGLLPPPPIVAVKAPVFSAAKLPGVDPVLGPNMKSTGEVLGMGSTPEIAMKKVLPSAVGAPLPELNSRTRVLLSVSDVKKHELGSLVRELSAKGVSLYGTPGTARYILQQWGVEVKSLTEEEWTEWLKANGDKVVVNVATRGNDPKRAGYRLRRACLAWQVPCFTSLETFLWYVRIAEEPTPVEQALVPITATGWKEVVRP